MSDSTSHLDELTVGQSSKEAAGNALWNAMSQNALFGRRSSTTSALTWGMYGGKYRKADGTVLTVANGTIALTDAATNYLLETDGVVSKVTAAPAGWPGPLAGGAKALYEIVCAAGAVTSYTDYRTTGIGSGGALTTTAADVSITDTGTYFTGTDVEAALQEIGADLAILSATLDADTDVKYTSDTGSTADSDPGAGLFTWNHATQASATELYVDDVTTAAVNLTTFFASLPPHGYIHLAQDDDSAKWQLWKWAAAPTAGAGYYKFTSLTLMAAGTALDDAKSTSISFKGTTPPTLTALLDQVGSAAQGDILYRNGTTWVRLPAGTAGQFLQTAGAGANPAWVSEPFDVQTFYPGIPTASAKIYRGKLARAVTFAANFAGSYFTASANATGSTVFDIQKNGSSIGSCTIGAGGVTPTFATSGGAAQSFAAGDILAIIAPGSADATLADPAITLAGTR